MMDKPPSDLADWLRACEGRELYQAVADQMGVTRAEAKPRVMAVLFGDPDQEPTRAARALAGMFPAVWTAIAALKRRAGYAALAHAGQRAESAFIYGRCVRRLMKEQPDLWVATIHDSIITTEGSEQVVEAVMRSEFDRRGLAPTLTTEPFRAKLGRPNSTRPRLRPLRPARGSWHDVEGGVYAYQPESPVSNETGTTL